MLSCLLPTWSFVACCISFCQYFSRLTYRKEAWVLSLLKHWAVTSLGWVPAPSVLALGCRFLVTAQETAMGRGLCPALAFETVRMKATCSFLWTAALCVLPVSCIALLLVCETSGGHLFLCTEHRTIRHLRLFHFWSPQKVHLFCCHTLTFIFSEVERNFLKYPCYHLVFVLLLTIQNRIMFSWKMFIL